MRRFGLFIALLVSAGALTAQDDMQPLEFRSEASGPARITFEGNRVVLSDVWDEDVVWLSAAREFLGSSSRFVYRDLIAVTDPEFGTNVVELESEVPEQSVWVAVGFDTGEYVVATPSGFPLREIPFPEGSLFPGDPEEPDFIMDGRKALMIMVVREKKGAWTMTTGDGTSVDADGLRDGIITLTLADLEPVGDSPEMQPLKFLPHDVVLGIDAFSFEFYAARVRDVWQSDDQGDEVR